MLTEEKINANYLAYLTRLERYGCKSETMINEIGEKLRTAPFTMTDSYGGAYRGALIDVTLNMICRIGFSINERVFGKNGGNQYQFPVMAVNSDKLMRVLLLSNISKAEMFEDETDQWRIKKGSVYRFVDNATAMKSGARSAYLCQKYGIVLDEEEFEAIMSIDDGDDAIENCKSPLYTIVQCAKAMTNTMLRHAWKEKHKQTILEK